MCMITVFFLPGMCNYKSMHFILNLKYFLCEEYQKSDQNKYFLVCFGSLKQEYTERISKIKVKFILGIGVKCRKMINAIFCLLFDGLFIST